MGIGDDIQRRVAECRTASPQPSFIVAAVDLHTTMVNEVMEAGRCAAKNPAGDYDVHVVGIPVSFEAHVPKGKWYLRWPAKLINRKPVETFRGMKLITSDGTTIPVDKPFRMDPAQKAYMEHDGRP